jgi:hypothetical protein
VWGPEHEPDRLRHRALRPRRLFDTLSARGYTIVGPTVRQEAIVCDEISSGAELPVGLTDEQDGGHYGLLPREDEAVFRYVQFDGAHDDALCGPSPAVLLDTGPTAPSSTPALSPTSQNRLAIEADLSAVPEAHMHLPDERLAHRCEQAIRNHDPCISRATHFLTLTVDHG